MKQTLSCLLIFLLLQITPNAQANCNFGQTIFRDSLYGGLIGSVVGALFLVANDSSKNIAPTVATGSLVGIGAGFVTGIVESSTDQCFSSKKKHEEEEGLTFKVTPLSPQISKQVNLYSHAQLTPVEEKFGEGISLSYMF